MAKKRKKDKVKGGAFGGSAAATQSTDGAGSRVKSGAFCLRSSLGVPFLVISDGNFVAGVPSPSRSEWQELVAMGTTLAKQWHASEAVVLADFEGECMGLEGELVSGAFQRTWALDAKGLRQMPVKGPSKDMGLLIDLRAAEGIALCKRLMESEATSKMMWGADGDVASLRYTPSLRPLGISSTQVVDAQLAFSSPKHRLAMSAMLERLPKESIEGLPNKAGIDFDSSHAFNRRALHIPLKTQEAMYAVDDLHRLDAIIRSQKPKGASYMSAQSQTSSVVSLVLHNIAGASVAKLEAYQRMLGNKSGLERQAVAVRVKRHLIALRNVAPAGCDKDFAALEGEADKVLKDASVCIPQDLAFFTNPAVVATPTVVSSTPVVAPTEVETVPQTATDAGFGEPPFKLRKTGTAEAVAVASQGTDSVVVDASVTPRRLKNRKERKKRKAEAAADLSSQKKRKALEEEDSA